MKYNSGSVIKYFYFITFQLSRTEEADFKTYVLKTVFLVFLTGSCLILRMEGIDSCKKKYMNP